MKYSDRLRQNANVVSSFCSDLFITSALQSWVAETLRPAADLGKGEPVVPVGIAPLVPMPTVLTFSFTFPTLRLKIASQVDFNGSYREPPGKPLASR